MHIILDIITQNMTQNYT